VAAIEATGYPPDAQMEVPGEVDPTFELTHDAFYDEDDGEPLDLDAVSEGITKEMKFMDSLQVEEAVPRPQGKKALGARWRHRRKADAVRSRLAVKQSRDAKAGDFYACTPRYDAIRVLLAAALFLKTVIMTTDFSAAFRHTPLGDEHEIYVEIPLEYGMGRDYVWRRRRTRCGLREAALRFQELLESLIVDLGFAVCVTEPTIYHHIEKGVRVTVHTDDPPASGPAGLIVNEVFDKPAEHVAIKGRYALGPEPIVCLGSTLQRLGGTIVELSKPGYMEGILEAAGMTDCRSVSTSGVRPDPEQPGAEDLVGAEDRSLCRRLCGKTQCAVPRRPDVMYPRVQAWLPARGRHEVPAAPAQLHPGRC
jgi:hypothetical protein